MNPRDDEERTRPFPGHRGAQTRDPYKFTEEEMRVMRECNRESFFQRCIPLGTLMGFTTYMGVKNGYFKPSARFGAAPKVTVAVIMGYFFGKFSYQHKCAEKLMRLPNSRLGEMLRQRKQGFIKETLEPGFGPSMSLSPFTSDSEQYSDVKSGSDYDLDSGRPQYDGLDDTHRPSLDNPLFDEDMPPVQQHTTTYDELRRKNREEYQQKRAPGYKSPASQTEFVREQPPVDESKAASTKRNKYGDALTF